MTALDTFDMSGDGNEDLLVGRRDGTVQVFNMPDGIDDASDIDNEVRQFYCDVSCCVHQVLLRTFYNHN